MVCTNTKETAFLFKKTKRTQPVFHNYFCVKRLLHSFNGVTIYRVYSFKNNT